MKEIWVNANPWNKEVVTTALESGADAVIVAPDKIEAVRELGRIPVVSEGGDLQWDRDVVLVEIRSAEDEERIVQCAQDNKKVVVRTTDWSIIPLENLVAQADNILVEVDTLDEARTFASVLEKGVDGLIVRSEDPDTIRNIIQEIKCALPLLELVPFTVESVRPLGMGDRVCVDTCSIMGAGEGCLVGNSSRALFLVHAESLENPYVSPRPFRVNAGPVHAYILTPGGRTRYLSELRTGDEVLGVNAQGITSVLIVGRVKIERRPLFLIEAKGRTGSAGIICQNAETVRLVGEGGTALSVVALKPGDTVLGFEQEGGRHFGHLIQETIVER